MRAAPPFGLVLGASHLAILSLKLIYLSPSKSLFRFPPNLRIDIFNISRNCLYVFDVCTNNILFCFRFQTFIHVEWGFTNFLFYVSCTRTFKRCYPYGKMLSFEMSLHVYRYVIRMSASVSDVGRFLVVYIDECFNC